MIRAYLLALDPTDAQVAAMRSHCGAQRVPYNWCLAQVKANWAQRAAEQTYGLSGNQPWWAENSKEAYASGCANLATALGNRKAGRARMARFKSKRRARLSCRFTTGDFGLGPDRRHVQLPVIGVVRTHESTRKLARHVEAGTARIRSATLSFQRGRWHVSFSVELPDPDSAPREGGRVVGVDLGIMSLAVLSTGETVPNPRHLDRAQRALRRAQRQASRRRGPDRRTRIEPSQRWRKARARADRVHTRVANLRRDAIHQFTTRLVCNHDVIVIEDLAVANMIRNRSLARRIADASWAEIRRQFPYKTQQTGADLIVADPWFASSKTCSGCGAAKAKLALSERTYVCMECGIVLDRDVNAAIKLAALAADRAQSVRERPEGTGVRHPLADAAGPPREEPLAQPHRREMVSR